MGRLHVRLTPRSSLDCVEGWDQDEQGRRYLKVRVRAVPIEGKANAALVVLLAKTLAVAKSQVRLVAGDTARLKIVEIDGLCDEEIPVRLTSAAPAAGFR